MYLRAWLPYAVWQQIRRKAGVIAIPSRGRGELATEQLSDNSKGTKLAKETHPDMYRMVRRRRWQIIGSSGTGIAPKLFRKKIADLDIETQIRLDTIFRKRFKELNLQGTVGELVGSTDVRILASCILFQKEFADIVLLTKDKVLIILAESMGLRAVENLEDL